MTDELQKREGGALVDPRSGKARGFEGMEQSDVIIPRIAIAQSTSKRVVDGDLRVGALYNTITGDTYVGPDGKPQLDFIACMFSKNRRFWDKQDKNNQICMSDDGKKAVTGHNCSTECPFNAYDWSVDEKQQRVAPACTLFYNYLSIISPFESLFPTSISMGRTSARTAKQLNSVAMLSGEDLFSRIYRLTTEKKENNKGAFYILKIAVIGRAPTDIYKKAEETASRLHKMNFSIHEEGTNEEPTGGDEIPF